jgi:uncharacterized membrane protein
MTTNPHQGQRSDPAETYGGYTGYRPTNPTDDPYGASRQDGSGHSRARYASEQKGQEQQQQQESYQPPESVRRKQGKKASRFSSSADPAQAEKNDHLFAFFSYAGFCFTGLFFFFFKKKRPFVRFHAAQSIVLFAPAIAAFIVIKILALVTLIPFIGWILAPAFFVLMALVTFPTLVLWILLMLLSWRGVNIRLPIVSHYADALMNRFPA